MLQLPVGCLRTWGHRSPGGAVNRRRRGSAMVLVLIATASAFLVGMSFLSRATAVPVVSSRLADYVQARQIAESGLETTLRALEADPNWHTKRPGQTPWVSNHPLLGGHVHVRARGFDPALATGAITITNHSFESQKQMLSDGVLGLGAQFDRTIGGWRYQRTSLLGLLPPPLGTKQDNGAPHGNTVASIAFAVGLLGAADVSRSLADTPYRPNTEYILRIDMKTNAVLDLLAVKPFIRLESVSGSTRTPVAVLHDARLLSLLAVTNQFRTLELRFQTGDVAPSGDIGIAFGAAAVASLIAELRFDNIRLEVRRKPFWIEADGHFGQASHRVRALVEVGDSVTPSRILRWDESP